MKAPELDVYAVIPTYNRPQLLLSLLARLDVPAARTVVVNTGAERLGPVLGDVREVFLGDQTKRNIQAWWNLGLGMTQLAAIEAGRPHATLVLNDDVEPQGPLAEPLRAALEASGADIAYPSQGHSCAQCDVQGTGWKLRRARGQVQPWTPPKANRMTGWCFMVRGDALRADERFAWWYGDNDLEWRAQLAGGTVEVAGVDVRHLHPGEQTAANPFLKGLTREDRRAFVRKWKRTPW